MQHRAPRLAFVLCLVVLCGAGSAVADMGAGVSSFLGSTHPGDWPQKGQNPRKTAFNPDETTIGSSNVSQLVLDWKASSRGRGYDAAVADGFVYVGRSDGMFVYPLTCGTGGIECDALWRTDEIAQRGPVVADDLVFTGGGGSVRGYPVLGCGQPVCEPVKTLDVSDADRTITAAGDFVVTTGQTYAWDQIGLVVFDLSQCPGAICEPAWTASIGPHESGSVAVSRDSIYVGGDHNMFVFDLAGCGAEVCSASWRGLTGRVGHADTTPTVAAGFVYLLAAAVDPNQRSLSAYPADGCGNPTCKPTWAADIGTVSAGDALAVARGNVWVSENGRLDAFNTKGCGNEHFCDPEWVGKATGFFHSWPTVASDVVYVGVRRTSVLAFPTSCQSDVCLPLTTLHTDVGYAYSIFVSNGKLVVSGSDGIEVFGLP